MTFHVISALCLSVFLSSYLSTSQNDTSTEKVAVKDRIFTGVQTRQGDLSFIMPIQARKLVDDGQWFGCTAFLIHPRWLLTAAHCDKSRYPTKIVLVNAPPETGQRQVAVKEWHNHPAFIISVTSYYNITHWWNDVALIYVDQDIAETPVPIVNATSDPWDDLKNITGQLIAVAGYGGTGKYEPVKTLYKTYMYPGAPCPEINSKNDSRFCLRGSAISEGICFGDSGGPSMFETATGKIAFGIHSKAAFQGCDNYIKPWSHIVYEVRISKHIDWIKEKLCEKGDKLHNMEYTCT